MKHNMKTRTFLRGLLLLVAVSLTAMQAGAQNNDSVKVDESRIFEVAEKNPQFPGGDEALLEFLGKNLAYPASCQEQSIQGRVYASFIVEKDGSITNLRIMRSPHPDLSAETIRVLKAMPQWKPGTQKGKPVRVNFSIPIMFRLPEQTETPMPEYETPVQDNGERIYEVAEVNPQFPGGDEALLEFLGKNLKYPSNCQEQGIQGHVYASFVVEIDGKITNAKIMRSPHPDMSKEVERLIGIMPPWIPGMQDGKPVRVKYSVPILFRLN